MSENESSDRRLAGSGGDDVSAATSVSGLGGEALRVEDAERGLRPVSDQAARVGWGQDVADAEPQPSAANDGTGQSEK